MPPAYRELGSLQATNFRRSGDGRGAPTTDDRIDLDVVRDHDQGVVCFHTAGIKKLASSFVNFGFVGGEAVKKKTAV